MKVKILSNTNYMVLENDINEFIKDKCVIDIKYQSMFVETDFRGSVPVAGTVVDRVLIMYEYKEGIDIYDWRCNIQNKYYENRS